MSNRRRRNPNRRPAGTYCPVCRQRLYQVLCHDGQVRWVSHRGELRCRVPFSSFGRRAS